MVFVADARFEMILKGKSAAVLRFCVTWSQFVLKFLNFLILSLDFSIIPSLQAAPQPPTSKLPVLPVSVELSKRQEEDRQQRDMTIPNTSLSNVPPLSLPSHTPSISPAATSTCNMESELNEQRPEERVVEKVVKRVEERKTNMEEETRKKPLWMDDDDDLPPMM